MATRRSLLRLADTLKVIEPATEGPIGQLAYLLDGVPPARLFDECLKLFLSGFGAKSYRLLQRYGLFEHLFPLSAAASSLAGTFFLNGTRGIHAWRWDTAGSPLVPMPMECPSQRPTLWS